MIGNFYESLKVGKQAEAYAEEFFKKQNIDYQCVQNLNEYRKKDIDYLTSIGTVECKMNFVDAMKYRPGLFVWIETSVGENKGWWYLSETDYYIFFDGNGKGILIQNNQEFKDFVNNLIENGDREINRFDYKPDRRKNKIITAKCMRLYLDQIENTNINFNFIVKRSTK